MVPDKFNMVDMEGIDILFSHEDIIPGLYQKLVESITQCRYQCLYNWYFDDVLIPPSYVEMVIIDDKVWIGEGVTVDEEDTLEVLLPALTTITGSTVYITNALSRKVEELICYINPLQIGSGEPSPDNIRPINGHTGLNAYRESSYDTEADPTVTINWQSEAGTIYGGSYEVIGGALESTMGMVDLGSLNWTLLDANKHLFRSESIPTLKPSTSASQIPNLLSDRYKTVSASTAYNAGQDCVISQGIVGIVGTEYILIVDKAYSDATSLKTAVTGSIAVFELAQPVEYTLTSQELTTLLGNNVIWHNANGDTSVTYWKK